MHISASRSARTEGKHYRRRITQGTLHSSRQQSTQTPVNLAGRLFSPLTPNGTETP